MIKIIQAIFGAIGILLAGFILITNDFGLMPYLMVLLGTLILLGGVTEIRKDRKGFWGYTSIVVSLFIFFVSIQMFLLK